MKIKSHTAKVHKKRRGNFSFCFFLKMIFIVFFKIICS